MGEAVARDKSVLEVANALGLGRRIVEVDCNAKENPAPHDRRKIPGRRGEIWLNEDEYRQWRERSGRLGDRHELFNAGAATAGGGAAGDEGLPPLETYAPVYSDEAVVAQLQRELGKLMQRLRGELGKAESDATKLSPSAIQSLTNSIKQLETTLSKRESSLREAEDREGRMIPRRRVESLLEELAVLFVSQYEGLRASLPAAVRTAVLEHQVSPEDADAFDRVAGVAVRERTEADRAAMADQLERAASELGVKGPGGSAAAEGERGAAAA